MAPHILCPLTFRPSANPVRHARIHDARMLRISLREINRTTPPGFYFYRGDLVEVYNLLSTPTRLPPSQSQSSVARPGPSAPNYIETPARLATISWGKVNQGELQEASAYTYTLDFIFGTGNANDPKWIRIGRTTRLLKYRLLLDVGGRTTTWAFSGARRVYLILPMGTVALSQGQMSEFQARKSRLPHEMLPGTVGRMVYGVGVDTVDLQPVRMQVTGICGMDNLVPTVIYDFTLGAAVGFNSSLLIQPFDGILGLGRSFLGTNVIPAPSFVQELLRQGRIQESVSYVCCRYETDTRFGDGFVSFGDWPYELHPGPGVWVDIPVHATSPPGLWGLWLLSINFLQPGHAPVPFQMDLWVMLDTGYAQTFLPNGLDSGITRYLTALWHQHGQNANYILEQSLVELVFRDEILSPTGQRLYRDFVIQGRAKQFFFHPKYMPDNDGPLVPLVPAIIGVPPGNQTYLPGILGINFFRTFVAGFHDRAIRPLVRLAPQP